MKQRAIREACDQLAVIFGMPGRGADLYEITSDLAVAETKAWFAPDAERDGLIQAAKLVAAERLTALRDQPKESA
jgi:hypothetical protein